MNKSGFRKAVAISTAGAAIGFIAWAFWPRAVPVEIAVIERGPMQVAITDEGRTRVRDIFRVSAPVSGRVLRIAAKVGDEVVAGQTVLAAILPSAPAFLDARALKEARAAVRASRAAVTLARADFQRAEAEVGYAATELKRTQALVQRRAKSEAALDLSELALSQAKAARDSANAMIAIRSAELETAEAVLLDPVTSETIRAGRSVGAIDIRAPLNGRVLSVMHQSEGVVPAGTALMELGDPTDIEVVVDLLSADAIKVAPGATVIIGDWGGTGSLEGVVDRIEPRGFTKVSALGIEEQRVNVIIDPVGDRTGWRKLGHGFRIEASIVTWTAEDVARVPAGALFRIDRQWAVFHIQEGQARLTTVDIDHLTSNAAQLVSGLKVGDQVVLYPPRALADGDKVTGSQP
ncbi:MAG: HlyD family efflux transporter periplasmic adaptor subunit [Rhodospirillaceae bacterium]|nr:HlyD family efflux transporter periplasmic adaptor subunit [Rhodospirillaceae bacterium]MBT6137314.1 HlyD family efflux transporter periplasmic adaptor subunit [Rhodospirillaceae bacterium]